MRETRKQLSVFEVIRDTEMVIGGLQWEGFEFGMWDLISKLAIVLQFLSVGRWDSSLAEFVGARLAVMLLYSACIRDANQLIHKS